ncbi:PRC-barrel domain-containing protein [Loktanella sp. SALINAS62]|uniref:PRC-barrel domain-containing protein n=1 Tax=Loktanella sp. SALINAS62 TaxID=2706124 RepID=UPI001B8CECD3|nr:PRC-barrel domain-containing protein [Loktanella sp. SALINAS62]MBS1303311.1 PRC-barrel domain containing protein [Loktanella sp. SALINAS62]
MHRSSDIRGYQLQAKDGDVGTIDDLLFDDRHFVLRWVVVDTGTWLPGRKVLLPPSALKTPDMTKREYITDLTCEQIKAAPGLETDKPVSRQLEVDIFHHYSWNPYWYGTFGAPLTVDMGFPVPPADLDQSDAPQHKTEGDPHLRSVDEVTGYYVEATDGGIGHIEDFMVDEDNWTIRYLMIDTKNWWPGKMVLVSPDWLTDIAWTDRKVFVDVTRDKVKGSPEFRESTTVNRDYEERMYAHYGVHPYWSGWA